MEEEKGGGKREEEGAGRRMGLGSVHVDVGVTGFRTGEGAYERTVVAVW